MKIIALDNHLGINSIKLVAPNISLWKDTHSKKAHFPDIQLHLHSWIKSHKAPLFWFNTVLSTKPPESQQSQHQYLCNNFYNMVYIYIFGSKTALMYSRTLQMRFTWALRLPCNLDIGVLHYIRTFELSFVLNLVLFQFDALWRVEGLYALGLPSQI